MFSFLTSLRKRAAQSGSGPLGQRGAGGRSAPDGLPTPSPGAPPPGHGRLASLLTVAAGRRGKWIVLALSLLALVAAASQAGRFEEAQRNERSDYLPGSSEAVEAFERSERFASGRVITAVVAYRRAGGLRPVDLAAIDRDRRALAAERPAGIHAPAAPVDSRDGTTALLVVPVDARLDGDEIATAIDEIRRRLAGTPPPSGLEVAVTGSAGFLAAQVEVFNQIDGALLIGTAALVLLLLVGIYRSPIFWILPFLAVLGTELASRGLGFGLTELGVRVNGQTASVLVVLVFGAGTDYALLLVARYREELRRHADEHQAMRVAVQRAGPAILASGATVVAALLVLVLADVSSTAGLGPVAAMGVGLTVLTSLTLLPALILVAGRGAFWPFVPRAGSPGADASRGTWRRIGERVGRAPRRVWVLGLVLLGVLSVGLTDVNTGLTAGNGFRGDVEAVEGQRLVERAFPAGSIAPADVVVGEPERAAAVRAALAGAPGVAALGPVERGAAGARFDLILAEDPYGQRAFDRIPALRKTARAAGGEGTLIGGPTAEEHDLRSASARDNRVIVPVVLLVVLLILIVLLRAVVAPLLVIGTVVASFAAALGASAFLFERVFGFEGMEPGLPLLAFIFLVALGVDYNIFLMHRAREETLRAGAREGILRALAVTGAVITSAGIVLTGTFGVLATFPLVSLTEIGVAVALGVLLDTFVVRSLVVPALVLELGECAWWPSRRIASACGSAPPARGRAPAPWPPPRKHSPA